MNFEEYKNIIKNDERVEWYGEMVPEKLITNRVYILSSSMTENLTRLESDISELRNGTKEKENKERYYKNQLSNLRQLPYSNNGLINDFYLIKYREILSQIEKEEKTKPKDSKIRINKVTTPLMDKIKEVEKSSEEPTESVVKGRRGKNNKLIFGK